MLLQAVEPLLVMVKLHTVELLEAVTVILVSVRDNCG